MRKKKKSTSYSHRVFAAVLAAALLFTMPGMASYAEAEDAQTEDISESVTVQAEDDAAGETAVETEAIQKPEAEESDTNQSEALEDDTEDTETDEKEPAEEETVPVQKEDVKECICGTLCTQDSINRDCPVCGAEDADLSRCKGEKTENSSEEKKEDAGQEDAGEQNDSANLCAHHKEHTKDCGYSRASEDGEGSLCTYECRICLIEGLIAALPQTVTEDNAETVRSQLDEILALYTELSEDEQAQLDLSPCWDLQAALDAANAPVTVDEPTEGAVAQVETDGNISYYDTIDAAWTAANGNTATITLLDDVTASGTLTVNDGTTITFDGGDYTLTSGQKTAIQVNGTLKLESGTIQSTYSNLNATGIDVNGTLEMTGGTVSTSSRAASASSAVRADSNSSITISGGKISGVYGIIVNGGTVTIPKGEISGRSFALYILSGTVTIEGGTFTGSMYSGLLIVGGTVILCGGTFTCGDGGYTIQSNNDVSTLLDPTKPYVYFDANGQPVNLSELEDPTKLPEGTYTVGECTHLGALQDKGDGTHGGDCPYCGKNFDAATHTLGADNKCEGCGTPLVASVKIGNATTYYGGIGPAWTAATAEGVTSAEITLLDNVTEATFLSMSTSRKITLNGGNYTLSVIIIQVSGGQLDISNGTFKFGGALMVSGGTVRLSGGKFINTNGQEAIFCVPDSNLTVGDFLLNYGDASAETHYAYYQDGQPIEMTGQTSLSGTVKVQECGHTGVSKTSNDNGTHSLKCPYCGYTGPEEDCSYSFSGNVGTCPDCNDALTVFVEDSGNLIYDGIAKTLEVTVKRGEQELTKDTDFTIDYTNNTNAGTASVTVSGSSWSYTENFTIAKANVVKENLSYTPPDLTYTGAPKKADVTADSLTGIGQITVKYKKDNNGDLLTEAIEPGTYHVYAVVLEGGNYKSAEIEIGSFTISYMDAPELRYNGNEQKGYYSGDVAISAVPADNYTYKVSDAIDGEYKDFFTISAQQGTVTKTLYFKDEAGHISDGVPVKVDFDLTSPTGKIAVGAKWWQKALGAITFGHYAAKEYTVTIKAEDTDSGIDKIAYAIVAGSSQYTDADALKAANLTWNDYDNSSKPTVPVNQSQYVVYARLTDKAGNVTYISTDGILLDSTPPTVAELTVPADTIKDVTAGFTFTVSEAADYYYVVLPKDSAAPSAENIIVTCGGTLPEDKTGNDIKGVTTSGKGAVSGDALPANVSVKAGNLSPNTEYTVYVTAVDRALDITNSKDGTPNGNIGNVAQADFTTKKTLPVITKAPTVTGIYGQSVGEMTVAGGIAKGGDTVLTGTWTVSDADKGQKPAAGTTEAVTITFTPDNNGYDSVSVEVIPTVNPRSLDADSVTISEVAGTYTYTGSENKPPVAVSTGKPASGISISDSVADLTENDFTVSYSNNKNAGTASVTITGKGNYTGSVTKTFTIGKASGRTIPDLTGSYTDDGKTYTYTIEPTEGAVYRMGDGAWIAVNVFNGITPGTSVTFSAKMPGNENYKEGEAKSITVDFPKLTPAAPALSYQVDRTDVNNVKVTISPVEGAEYSFDGGMTWKSGEGANVQGGFDTSQTVTLSIRLKATVTHNQSPVQTVTVDLAKKDREAPPAFSLKIEANGETDYTVTIPPTEGCEYSFDGENWSESNVKTGAKVGETVTGYKRYKETNEYNASNAVSDSKQMPKFTVKTPVITPAGGSYTGSVSVTITCGSPDAEIYYTTDGSTPAGSSTRYTGAFTVTAPATVKAIAIKEGLTDSDVATASYTKQGSGGSGGGNSGNTGNTSDGNTSDGSGSGNENSGDSGQGSNGGNGSGNTTPVIPAIPSAAGTVPGTGTETAKPGKGNTARPGTGTEPESSTAKEERPDTGIPFIKGEDGKIGWNVIRAEEEKAEEGSVINVDMNGTTVVPGDIFDSIKGRDITITFDMGNGIIWSVDGKSVTRDASRDKADDIDFTVRMGGSTVPVEIVNSCFANNVTGEHYSIQISLAHDGEFGFIAVLSVGIGEENAGYLASLYYYNEDTGELEFICADEVAQDGMVSYAFTHASDYVVVVDRVVEEQSGTEETTQPEGTDSALPQDRTDGNGGAVVGSPKEGQTRSRNVPGPIIAGIIALAGIGAGIVIAVKKKRGKKNNG